MESFERDLTKMDDADAQIMALRLAIKTIEQFVPEHMRAAAIEAANDAYDLAQEQAQSRKIKPA
jgi:N-methylhydantoinase B/oxoprolinase/acetone carboxylase alpha subunit